MSIDPKLIDFDHKSAYGHTGWIEDPNWKLGKDLPVYEECFAGEQIAESDIDNLIELNPLQCFKFWNPLYARTGYRHQGNSHFCVSNGTAACAQAALARMHGVDYVPAISTVATYQRATNMRERGGSNLGTNVKYAKIGLLPSKNPVNDALFKYTWPENEWVGERLPDGWEETGKLLQLVEVYEVATPLGVTSALLNDHACLVARNGHSIAYGARVRDERTRPYKYLDSYGELGGDGSRYDSERTGNSTCRNGVYVFRAMAQDTLPKQGD